MTDKQLCILIAAVILLSSPVEDRDNPQAQLRAWNTAKTLVNRANGLAFP